MKQTFKNILLGAVPFIFLCLLWLFASNFSLLPSWIIPTPSTMVETFWQLLSSGKLFRLAWVSLQNAMLGFVLSAIVAISLGIPIGMYPTMRKIFLPFLSAIYVVPSLAWLPVIIIFLGFTKSALITIIVLSSFKKIIFNAIGGVRNVDANWILAGRNIGLNRLEVTYKIILPAALPEIITGLRLGFGSAWRTLVGAEMIVAGANGLGRFIWNAQWFFAFDQVFSGIIMIAIVGLLMEQLVFRKLENQTIIKWGFVKDD